MLIYLWVTFQPPWVTFQPQVSESFLSWAVTLDKSLRSLCLKKKKKVNYIYLWGGARDARVGVRGELERVGSLLPPRGSW